MSQFHSRLKELKDGSGKTQARIADDLGITPQALSYYINGREPDYDVLMKIASYFDVSVDYLVGASDCKKNENQPIQKELGLSEPAIEKIKKYSQSMNMGNCITLADILSEIISSPLLDDVLMFLNMYLEMQPEDWEDESKALKEHLKRPNLFGITVRPESLKYFVRELIMNAFGAVINSLPDFPSLSMEERNKKLSERSERKAPPKQD